jgi:hypothetical protein
MGDPLVLFGVEIGGEVPADAIATAVVVLVEVIEGEDSKPHLRLLFNVERWSESEDSDQV